jgi:hypothetical protein
MNITATDTQSGKSITLTDIQGGDSKTGQIQTGKTTLAAGTVSFGLSWTDGHSGTDSRTAPYNKVSNCQPPSPSPSPTPKTTPKPSPSALPSVSPTICPTLGPVKNVHIDCPNCPK